MAARENLSRSEKSSKAAEMNLQLAITQHDRTIANLRQQLKDFDEDRTRILQLQQTVAELKEEIEEKDELLRRKCDEIEANDDKAIA
jgi:myosin protein heavy chain